MTRNTTCPTDTVTKDTKYHVLDTQSEGGWGGGGGGGLGDKSWGLSAPLSNEP